MTTQFAGARAAALRTRLLAAALFATVPVLSSCVSAVDDSSAFGFSNLGADAVAADAAESIAADASASEDAAPAEAAQSAAPEEIVAASQPAAATPPPATAAESTPSLLRPTSVDGKAVAAYAGGSVTEGDQVAALAPSGKETSLFSSLFARSNAKPPVPNADKRKGQRVVLRQEGAPVASGDFALPGVDPTSLFEIGQRASAEDEDLMEDSAMGYQVASLTGMARLSPNGLRVQREDVDTSCFPSQLVGMLRSIERKFGKKVIVTSGYRSPTHNRRVNGATRSQHMGCKAADIVVPDADRFVVAAYARSLPGRGGVGTYCHSAAIHVDVGPQRDWNWRCRQRK
ncbi:YcbK family protein [Aurantimonas aggregata]|uniref:YcbK family protein n=1 Tax=Aurantimonas aggregata TaxID=2047720 RepID=UPI001FE5739D|nr:D-Ala-D-Ala carboxypeptidase family metallohydrolase [Aurantimonas aggregata]